MNVAARLKLPRMLWQSWSCRECCGKVEVAHRWWCLACMKIVAHPASPCYLGLLEGAKTIRLSYVFFLIQPCQLVEEDKQWQPCCDDSFSWHEQKTNFHQRQVTQGWAGWMEETVFASGSALKCLEQHLYRRSLWCHWSTSKAGGMKNTAASCPLVDLLQEQCLCHCACSHSGGIAAELFLLFSFQYVLVFVACRSAWRYEFWAVLSLPLLTVG